MAAHSNVTLDPKRVFGINDLNFGITARVEMTNITLCSNLDRSFYVDIVTRPIETPGDSVEQPPSNILGLGTHVNFDISILEHFDSSLLASTTWRVGSFFHSNTVSKTTQSITIRIVQDKNN